MFMNRNPTSAMFHIANKSLISDSSGGETLLITKPKIPCLGGFIEMVVPIKTTMYHDSKGR